MSPPPADESPQADVQKSDALTASSGHTLDDVLAEVSERRAAGETLPDEQVIAAHPDLMPQLGRQLELMRAMRRAQILARTAGPAAGTAADAHVVALSLSRLDEPITAGPLAAAGSTSSGSLPHLHGYRLLREVSAGGQATVYQAVQESTGRTVAVKVLFGGPFLSARGRGRFEREAAVLARLDHPHIVRIVDRGRSPDGSFYLVMDYIDGPPLDQALARHRWPLEQVVGLLGQVAEAAAEAHAQGIVHRDLKPANVRLDARGEPHVLDFGLARLLDAAGDPDPRHTVTLSGRIVGSLPWASPEQAGGGGGPVDARTDVYALGVMLYEALAGAPPYPTGGPMHEAVRNIREAVPPPFAQVPGCRYEVPAALEAVVFKALAKRPGQRYATAAALAADLRAALAGQPTLVTVPPRPTRLRRRAAQIALAIGAILLLAASLAAVYAMWFRDGSSQVVTLPEFTNQVGMRLVLMPAGTFKMGSPRREAGRGNDEGEHQVQLNRPFYLGVTEVTAGQYRAVMGSVPHEGATADLPVTDVTWQDAVAFCERLSQREHRRYRLPTEAEWEYACRAGSRQPYSGNGRLEEMGWFKGNSDGTLHPVKLKQANSWGLFDMHGNAAEWCADGYEDAPATAFVVDPRGLDGALHRVVRGGSAVLPAEVCRSGARSKLAPDAKHSDVSFRVALEPGSGTP